MILLAYQEESNTTCQKLEEVVIYSFFIHAHTTHHKTSFKKLRSE
jgi:hypothetical protein